MKIWLLSISDRFFETSPVAAAEPEGTTERPKEPEEHRDDAKLRRKRRFPGLLDPVSSEVYPEKEFIKRPREKFYTL
jgi:hypothetical protein